MTTATPSTTPSNAAVRAPFTRGDFGEIINVAHPLIAHAQTLLGAAIAAGKLPAMYIEMDRKRHGSALNYDFYDISRNGAALLVQRRRTTFSKYGTSPTKDYFIVRRQGRGVVVTEVERKAVVVKLSKVSTAPGQVIDTLEGRAKRPLKLTRSA